MAMTATIALSKSSASVEMPVNAAITISNSGGAAVNITSCVGSVVNTSPSPGSPSVAIGTVAQGPGINLSVPASGTLILSYSLIAHAVSPAAGSGTYSVGAAITGSDGSSFAPTPATLTVTAISLPDST